MKDKTVLVLAAGLGSRFGGLKQITPFGPNQEFIIDYSVYDAIRCGFNKVVFLIKEENYEIFRDTIGKRIENKIKVEYAFQNNDNVPSKYSIPSDRLKPLGTAHAVLCCKDKIHEPFITINADDFYGYDAFKQAGEFLDNNDKDYSVIGYKMTNTLTENGSVKRGVLFEKNGNLDKMIESVISKEKDGYKANALLDDSIVNVDENTKVSMNMFAFFPNIFDYIEKNFDEFLSSSDLSKAEYLLPEVVTKAIKEKYAKVKITDTTAKWVGVTYKEDTPSVINYINSLIDSGIYKKDLWG